MEFIWKWSCCCNQLREELQFKTQIVSRARAMIDKIGQGGDGQVSDHHPWSRIIKSIDKRFRLSSNHVHRRWTKISKGRAYIVFKVVPLQTQPFIKVRHFIYIVPNAKWIQEKWKVNEVKSQPKNQMNVSMVCAAINFYILSYLFKLMVIKFINSSYDV